MKLVLGPLSIDPQTYSAFVDGERVRLTAGEFDLLAFLVENQDRVVAHAEIAGQIFGATAGDTASLVRVHICHLRRAIGRAAGLITTIRGRGYRLAPP